MAWRHYEVRQSGDCQMQDENGISSLRFTMGIVETGKQHVFSGHFVCLILTDHDPITGEDEHSLRAALWKRPETSNRLASGSTAWASAPRSAKVGSA